MFLYEPELMVQRPLGNNHISTWGSLLAKALLSQGAQRWSLTLPFAPLRTGILMQIEQSLQLIWPSVQIP